MWQLLVTSPKFTPPFFLVPFVEETVFSPVSSLGSAVKYDLTVYARLSIRAVLLFHWSVRLCICWYHTILITLTL